MKLHLAITCIVLTASAAQAAETAAVRVTSGLPQLTQIDGRTLAWRYLTVRADVSLVAFEANLSDCISVSSVASASSTASTSGARTSSCLGGEGDIGFQRVSQQFQARLRAPRLFEAGPDVDFTLRNWRTGTGHLGATGSSAEVELSRPIGPVKAFTGYSVPIGRVAPSDDLRTAYAGFRWSPVLRHSMEVSTDWSRQAHSAALDREASVVYSYANGRNTRWQFSVTRAVDDAVAPWRSGVGLDWSF